MKFSVVIPTLQKSQMLERLVSDCAALSIVGEIIVINNALKPLHFPSPKVRVLNQGKNIFVNAAWNLGAREAREPLLAILNDDLQLDTSALFDCAHLLEKGCCGVVGLESTTCFGQTGNSRRPSYRYATRRPVGFGTFMCMRLTDYQPIPESLLIWKGNDWLFWLQRKPNILLVFRNFVTEMNTTSGRPEFNTIRDSDTRLWDRYFSMIWGRRWWHKPMRFADQARQIRHRIRSLLRI